MNQYALENIFGIKGFNIAWYGIIIGVAMLLGIALAAYRCRKTKINPDNIYDLALWLIPICIVCARIYYIIFEWDRYKNNLLSVFMINKGGLAIYGGVVGGVIVCSIYCRIKKISFLSLADTLLPSLVLGQAIGRWGNFINQEAYGNLITNPKLQFFPYGVYIEKTSQWYQATFFYESSLNVLLFTLILICYPHFKYKGCLLPFYMIGYGTIRFFIEGLRTDSLYLSSEFRVSQLLSLILILGGIGYIILTYMIRRKEEI